jgi:hypothetical protein
LFAPTNTISSRSQHRSPERTSFNLEYSRSEAVEIGVADVVHGVVRRDCTLRRDFEREEPAVRALTPLQISVVGNQQLRDRVCRARQDALSKGAGRSDSCASELDTVRSGTCLRVIAGACSTRVITDRERWTD